MKINHPEPSKEDWQAAIQQARAEQRWLRQFDQQHPPVPHGYSAADMACLVWAILIGAAVFFGALVAIVIWTL